MSKVPPATETMFSNGSLYIELPSSDVEYPGAVAIALIVVAGSTVAVIGPNGLIPDSLVPDVAGSLPSVV